MDPVARQSRPRRCGASNGGRQGGPAVGTDAVAVQRDGVVADEVGTTEKAKSTAAQLVSAIEIR
jgi:hypothetical protein